MRITEAIILAGGMGTRLAKLVNDRPKPMADINGKPFLHYLIVYLKDHGVNNVILSVGHLKQQIIECFGGSYLGINIKYAQEDVLLGTGGAVLYALQYDTSFSALQNYQFVHSNLVISR